MLFRENLREFRKIIGKTEFFLILLKRTSINFPEVVKLCRYHVSSVLFYLFPVALDEFILPLNDHLTFMMDTTQQLNFKGQIL